MHRRISSCLLAVACVAALGSRAAASEVCVPNNAIDVTCDTPAASINAAIAAAANGDTIIVGAGTYSEFVVINKNVTLRSISGRAGTTISPPSSPAGNLGTILVSPGSNGVKIGTAGHGFTINGLDNSSPGIESAAIYFQGSHTSPEVVDNEIVAAGDTGLTTEFGAAITGMVIDGNEFSGQTFVGTPADNGFANQFSTPNVPRQLVVIGNGGGAGASATNGVVFTNNLISGTAGGINGLGQEQGNTLVTIDASGSTITGNTFAGNTTRFATSLRVRRPNVTISGNTFDSTGLVAQALTTPGTAHLFLQNSTADIPTIYAANTFDRAAYVASPPLVAGSIGVGPGTIAPTAPANSVVEIQPGTYADQFRVLNSNVTVNGNGAIIKPDALITDTTQGSPCSNGLGTAIVMASGATGVVFNDLNVDASLITTMPDRMIGIYFRNASGAINGGSVVEVRNKPLNGVQNGLGIYVQAKGPNVADVDITGVTVSGYQKNGVTFNGCGCAGAVDGVGTGTLTGSTITGAGDTPVIAQNGVQVGFGGSAVQISGNSITGHRYTGNPANGTAAGVLVFSATNNVIDSNLISGGNSGIVFQGGSFGLCLPADATGNTATCNRIENHDALSYDVGVSSDSANNSVTSNAFQNNTTAVDGTDITSGSLDAENNFWGAGDGPSGAGPGSGDAVTVNVDFTPFSATVPACVECTSDAQCDDGLACTGTETCNIGTSQCQTGTPVTCNAECQTGVCLEPSGTCQLDPDGTVCNGTPDSCSIPDFCTSGSCTEGGSGDPDNDGVCSADDNCPADANPSQADLDNDGIGDVCDGVDATLNPTRARVRRNTSINPARPNGIVKVSGDFIVNLPGGDTLASPAGYAARVVAALGLDTDLLASPPVWPAASCTVKTGTGGVVKTVNCKTADKNSTLVIRAVNPIIPTSPQVYKFTITLRRIDIAGPFNSPVVTTLEQSSIDRVGVINDCQLNQSGLSCKEG